MVIFQDFQKWGFQNFTISEFQNGDYPKRRFPISFIGNGDFENIRILKEREGDNLGDGNISGIPKFEMMASLGNFETLNFQTLGEIRNDATHEITKSKNGPRSAFSIY